MSKFSLKKIRRKNAFGGSYEKVPDLVISSKSATQNEKALFFSTWGEKITCFVNCGLGLSQTQNKEV